MLLLSIILLSGCLSDSLGNAIGEFQENFEAVVKVANKELFLPVPSGKFQCDHVPCQLARTIEQLKVYFKNDPTRTQVALMETNMKHIISTLNRTHAMPERSSSCPMSEFPPWRALKCYKKFFEKLQEEC